MFLAKTKLVAGAIGVVSMAAVAMAYPQFWQRSAQLAAPAAVQSQAVLVPAGSSAGSAGNSGQPDGPVQNTAVAATRGGSADVRVDAPGTNVRVDKERGKVRVQAPYANVKVDPDRGQVRVRAPYVDLDIRW
jgi:hypothetical protein